MGEEGRTHVETRSGNLLENRTSIGLYQRIEGVVSEMRDEEVEREKRRE